MFILYSLENYTVLCSNDSAEIAKCFIYEESSTDYVVFDFRDSIYVYRGQKDIEVRMRQASGHRIFFMECFNG